MVIKRKCDYHQISNVLVHIELCIAKANSESLFRQFVLDLKPVSPKWHIKEAKSDTMNIFRFFFYFLFKSFVKVELSYVFAINLFTIAENCTEK